MELPQPVDVDRAVVKPDGLHHDVDSRRPPERNHGLDERIEHVVHVGTVLLIVCLWGRLLADDEN